MKNYNKYRRLYDWKKPNIRKWIDREITKAPIWCSVDLRDGNQALADPMTLEEKIIFFDYLVSIGFKEIEIGFPAASETEYNFTRYLIENNKIPNDVTIQVLTQSREEIIAKTFGALKGAKNAIVHLYNSTSKIQREVVFAKSKEEIKEIATSGAKRMVEYVRNAPDTNWFFEYSPESFTNTEIEYAIEVVNEVLKIWDGNINTKPIINFPATVESSTPNVFADQIEYVCENIYKRDNTIISIHAHNDRGTAVASSEMALLAGADRIEGTLFGNGERTGNADIMNIAMNMYVTGVDPELDFSHINEAKDIYESCTKMSVQPRHPYAGEFVFTAFSGSHQDAISKGLKAIEIDNKDYWEVPYLPLDPADINREYEPIIRINSQSGKGGIAYILDREFGYNIPKIMQKDVGAFFKIVSDKKKKELTNDEIYNNFKSEYINRDEIIKLRRYDINNEEEKTQVKAILDIKGKEVEKVGIGEGPIDAFTNIMKQLGYKFNFEKYNQESTNKENEKSKAVTYINIIERTKDKNIWAVGEDKDVIKSSFKGIVSAINRM